MIFNSIEFLIFFPLVCLCYFLIPHKFRYLFLLGASYYFYMCWNPRYAVLMLISTVITYLSGIFITMAGRIKKQSRRERCRKWCVALSFLSNLSILFFFKYFDFAFDSVSRVLGNFHIALANPGFDIILPVGISFYTFQALSYTMDIYREEIYAEKNFFKYALFVSFFPQLVAGPIERSKNLLKQISQKHTFDFERMRSGLLLMLYGYLQKVVIADNLGVIVDTVYNNYKGYSGALILLATVLFAFQIYCDFGSYSNIAVGAARIMGFSLMENFNAPYFANSVKDFWRRWHISLSTWFRDYLYIPLGGNKKGKLRKQINTMIVFLCSGLWHGASWHFVVWGGLNGLYQVIGEWTQPLRDKAAAFFHINRESFSHQALKVLGTFALIDFSWLFFRADGFMAGMHMLKRILFQFNFSTLWGGAVYELGLTQAQILIVLVAMAVMLVVDVCKFRNFRLGSWLCKQGIWLRWAVYFGVLFYILIFGYYGPQFDASQFIYFQF